MKNFRLQKLWGACAVVVGMLVATGGAKAASYTWTGASSTLWGEAGNWSPRGVPTLGDSATIGDGRSVLLGLDTLVTDLTTGVGTTILGSPVLTVAGTFTDNGSNLDGAGALAILSGAAMNYNGSANPNANGSRPLSNSGTVSINSGTLVVGTASLQNAGTLKFNGGNLSVVAPLGLEGVIQILGGSVRGIGTINGHVTNAALFAPGYSPGTITINGNYTQTSTGRLDMEIGGTSPGTGYDQLIVKGSATLGGTINLIRYNNYLPPVGSSFKLITYYSVAGSFTTIYGLYPSSDRYYKITKAPSYFLASVSWSSA